MSDLTTAMQAAVESVDARRRPQSVFEPRPTSSGVDVLQEHDLPPIRAVSRDQSFSQTLAREYGPGIHAAWIVLREGLVFVVLFWTAAILAAFVVAEQATVGVVLAITLVLRGALALARASGRWMDLTP